MTTFRLVLPTLVALLAPAALSAAHLDQRIAQLFENKCTSCHFGKGNVNAAGRKGRNPILDAKTTRAALLAADVDGDGWINAAEPAKSTVHTLCALPADDEDRMPKNKKLPGEDGYVGPLTSAEIADLLAWVSAQ